MFCGTLSFWIYPAQTILCGALLPWFHRCYEFHGLKNVAFTLVIGLAVFVIWIAPQQFFNFPPRRVGFDGAFLLRFVIDEYFEQVPFDKFSWPSFAIVTVAFSFSHSRPDWIAAFVCGALYSVVAYPGRSRASCILAHAITNLLLGLWIMQTRQSGFW